MRGDDHGPRGRLRGRPRSRRPAPGTGGWSARRAAAGRARPRSPPPGRAGGADRPRADPPGWRAGPVAASPSSRSGVRGRPLLPDQRVVRRPGAAPRVGEAHVLHQLGHPARGHRRPSPTCGRAGRPARRGAWTCRTRSGPETSRCSPAVDVEPVQPRAGRSTSRSRTCTTRPAAPRRRSASARSRSGGRGLRTCSRSATSRRRSASFLRRARVRSTRAPLKP